MVRAVSDGLEGGQGRVEEGLAHEACGGFPQVFFIILLFCRFYSIKEKRKKILFSVSYNHLIFSVLMYYLYIFYCSLYRVRQMSVNRVCSLATTSILLTVTISLLF